MLKRRTLVLLTLATVLPIPAMAADLGVVPVGTTLVVADQNQQTQVLLQASGEQSKLKAGVTYANFLGGPSILEAFRAGALDLAFVGNTPPIQAQAAGEKILIVAGRTGTEPDYNLALRTGLQINSFAELKGKKIAYAEGTGRQPFVLSALKLGGLTRKDVKLVNLRAADFPDAIRTGQVDVAVLNEPHYSRYLADFGGQGAKPLALDLTKQLPRSLSYLYAGEAALKDPAKSAAIADFVRHWIVANKWAKANPDGWVEAYYVKAQKLKAEDGRAVVSSEGEVDFPPLASLVPQQQGLIDLIHAAGDLPKPLNAREEFDLRFDAVIAGATD
jgi:sulfonate transport system substrate-binding protein